MLLVVLFKYVTLKQFKTRVFYDTKFEPRCAIHASQQSLKLEYIKLEHIDTNLSLIRQRKRNLLVLSHDNQEVYSCSVLIVFS